LAGLTAKLGLVHGAQEFGHKGFFGFTEYKCKLKVRDQRQGPLSFQIIFLGLIFWF